MTNNRNNNESRHSSRRATAARFVYGLGLAAAMTALAACNHDAYDTGDGPYSYLTAQLAMLQTSNDGAIYSAATDDGDGVSISFVNPFKVEWAQRPDTIYRALLYYDMVDSAALTARARSAVQVPVLHIVGADKVKDMRTDPLSLESVWMSPMGDYLNMSLLLKSGKASADDAAQTLAVVDGGTEVDADGRSTRRLLLYHDQGEVPQYYTVQRYVSIDMRQLRALDSVRLVVNTYKGVVEKTIKR